jgi:hypothetical protein
MGVENPTTKQIVARRAQLKYFQKGARYIDVLTGKETRLPPPSRRRGPGPTARDLSPGYNTRNTLLPKMRLKDIIET